MEKVVPVSLLEELLEINKDFLQSAINSGHEKAIAVAKAKVDLLERIIEKGAR